MHVKEVEDRIDAHEHAAKDARAAAAGLSAKCAEEGEKTIHLAEGGSTDGGVGAGSGALELKNKTLRLADADEVPVDNRASSPGLDKEGKGDSAKQWRWLLDLINVKRLRLILPKFNRNTPLGADGVRMRDLMASSDECLEHLCGIMKKAVIEVTLPIQAMLTLLFLIGKKKPTESRTVANSPTFYRILMALLKDALQQWDKAFAEPEDTAAPGKRADDEVARRCMTLEVARYRKQCAAIILWDAKQYFDRLTIPEQIITIKETAFPERMGALAMIGHRAPRRLTYNGAVSEVIGPTGCSVLTGCTTSPSLARGRMTKVSNKIKAAAPNTTNHRHVDDLVQTTIGWSRAETVSNATKAGIICGTELMADKCVISDKSVVVASDRETARQIATAIRAKGFTISDAEVGVDLGASTAGGARRSVESQKVRSKKGWKRSRRVGAIVRKETRGQQLVMSGVKPMSGYENLVRGTAPTHIDELRRTFL